LNKLGRDLSKIIIIDNVKDNYQLQPENGLNIRSFMGEENDEEFIYLKDDLISIYN